MHGGREGERRHDDFPAQSPRARIAISSATVPLDTADAVPDADPVGNPSLELLDVLTVVGQPTSIQQVVDPLPQPLAIADVGTSDVEHFAKGRLAAGNGQLADCVFTVTRCTPTMSAG